jgi:hypothetical protein
MFFFAQDPATAATAATAASSLLSGRSDSMLVLAGVLVLAGLWIWYIAIPKSKVDQESRKMQDETSRMHAETLDKLTQITSTIHNTTSKSGTTLNAIMMLKKIEVECFDIIANETKCNIGRQLSEMRGVVMAVENGATTS